MSHTSSRGTDPVKVKVIVTQFVQTDEEHFKSVVQSLTGKDSVVAVERPPVVGPRKHRIPGGTGARAPRRGDDSTQASVDEFERLLTELQSLDELRMPWADHSSNAWSL